MKNETLILVVVDGEGEQTTFGAFAEANESMVETGEMDDVVAALDAGKSYVGGGGAAPTFAVYPPPIPGVTQGCYDLTVKG